MVKKFKIFLLLSIPPNPSPREKMAPTKNDTTTSSTSFLLLLTIKQINKNMRDEIKIIATPLSS